MELENGQPVGGIIDWTTLGHMLPKGISFPLEMSAELLAEYGFAFAKATPWPEVGLLESVQPAGYVVADGVYYPTSAVSLVDTLEAPHAIVVAEIEALPKSKRDAVVADYSPAEMAAWSVKRARRRWHSARARMLRTRRRWSSKRRCAASRRASWSRRCRRRPRRSCNWRPGAPTPAARSRMRCARAARSLPLLTSSETSTPIGLSDFAGAGASCRDILDGNRIAGKQRFGGSPSLGGAQILVGEDDHMATNSPFDAPSIRHFYYDCRIQFRCPLHHLPR